MNKLKIDGIIGFWGVSAQEIRYQLENINGDVEVEVNSVGGSVFEGVMIHNAFKEYSKTKGKVHFIVDAMAMSIASYIIMSGDSVTVKSNSTVMIHNASTFAEGDYRTMENAKNILFGLTSIIRKAYKAVTGKSEEELQNDMDSEKYLFGEEIKKYGFAQNVIEVEEVKKDESTAFAKEAFKACMVQVKEKESAVNITELAAAMGVNPASAKITNQKEENSMDEASITASEERNAEAVTNAVMQERARVDGILALNGADSVKKDAIAKGLSVGDCAIELNKHVDAKLNEQRQTFEASAEALNENVTSAEASNPVDPVKAAMAKDDEAYYAKKGAK